MALQLTIARSTVDAAIKEVYNEITFHTEGQTTPRTTTAQILHKMRGLQNIAGLPQSIEAVDGTYVSWSACASDQYYE